MIFTSPAEVLHGLRAGQGRPPRHHQGAAAEGQDASRAKGPRTTSPARSIDDHRRPRDVQRRAAPQMAFYNIPMKGRDLANVISDCYQLLGRRATIELLGQHEGTRLPPGDRKRHVVRHQRPEDGAQQGQGHRRRRDGGAQAAKALRAAASSPIRSATTRCSTPGPTLAS